MYIMCMSLRENEKRVFEYFDYCIYLRDFYEDRKKKDSTFSHRIFLKSAGIKGTSYLLRIIKGTQKLGKNFIPHFIRALGLSKKEAVYFEALVLFKNSRKRETKLSHLQALLKIRSQFPEYTINDKKYKFFSKWYYPLIRELTPLLDFKEDYNLLGRMVIPVINAAQARNAVKYLVKNNFLKKEGDGTYVQTEPIMSTGDQVHSTYIAEYHKTTLEQAAHAVHSLSLDTRDISSLIVGVSDENFEKIRGEIQDLRKRILAIAGQEQEPKKVCFVGLQLIPKSKDISQE